MGTREPASPFIQDTPDDEPVSENVLVPTCGTIGRRFEEILERAECVDLAAAIIEHQPESCRMRYYC